MSLFHLAVLGFVIVFLSLTIGLASFALKLDEKRTSPLGAKK
jgi:hypothetical protein